MNSSALQATSRTRLGKQVKSLRRQQLVPAVLYGHNVPARSLAVESMPFNRVYAAAGGSSLIDLAVDDGQPVKVLIHEVARDPLSDAVIHVDFHQVDMQEKITTEITLDFAGDAPAVKELGGVFVANHDKITVECLPQDLVHDIQVDISVLKTFDDTITVGALKLPAGLEVKLPADDIIALVSRPRSEAELAALEEEVKEDVAGIGQVETKKETDDETVAEGEAAPSEPSGDATTPGADKKPDKKPEK